MPRTTVQKHSFLGTALLILALLLAACSSTQDQIPAAQDEAPEAFYQSIEDEISGRVGTDKQTGLSVQAVAGLTPAPGATLASTLQGAGVAITNVTYTGAADSAGTFSFNDSGTADAAAIGFGDGIILSSGRVVDVTGPNNLAGTSGSMGTAGDAALDALVGGNTLDAAVLEIKFIPDGPRVFFEYVFSSEEYNEYVNSQFNDVFAFFVNGVNYALVNGGPISVNNINAGNTAPAGSFPSTATNTEFYRNNAGGAFVPSLNLHTEMDGLTVVLTFQAPVNIGVENTIRLAIADRADRILDSAVFIKAGTFSTTPPVNAGPDVEGDEGSLIALNGLAPDEFVAETHEWTISNPTCTIADPSALVTTVTCADNGVFTATLTVSSAAFGTYSDDALVTVHNVAPTIANLSVSPALVVVNTPVTGTADFTDPGTADTHTAAWDWNANLAPGSETSSGDVIQGAGSGSVAKEHTYTTPGVYTVELTVTDDDGGFDSEIYQYIVVYDPSAGFVTGGGWIDSPAGAYTAGPTLAGKANFGFVSKYKKGATVPDGQTQFQFHAAGFNFHSTVYEWLVVSGPKAQYKGSGTVNGAGDYGFMLTANDGQANGGGGVDRFRLKVWDKSTGDIVYDNQLGDADDTAASDAIEGGSIVIHSK